MDTRRPGADQHFGDGSAAAAEAPHRRAAAEPPHAEGVLAMALEAYPLTWPDGWKRTSAFDRKNGKFNKRETSYRDGHPWSNTKWLTVTDGVSRILESLEKMGVDRQDVIIS